METKIKKFQAGIALLAQPVLPLVSMVQFLYLTGEFTTVNEVIDEMPEPIETGYALYTRPRELLRKYIDHLGLLEQFKNGTETEITVVQESGLPVDAMTACTALMSQRIMTAELEPINSLLCQPCGCTLCCIGPNREMRQEFFEIPLRSHEVNLFHLDRHDTPASRSRLAMNDKALQIEGSPFYQCADPGLFHWQNGWSLILPKESACPGLEDNGRCRVYTDRPQVCRKPQIFSYVLEKTEQAEQYMLRETLLAIMDCPYVQALQEEIAAYAAACELELVLKENKQ